MPHRLCLVVGGETCPLGQGRDWKDHGLVPWERLHKVGKAGRHPPRTRLWLIYESPVAHFIVCRVCFDGSLCLEENFPSSLLKSSESLAHDLTLTVDGLLCH